jgi:hypothetical protein
VVDDEALRLTVYRSFAETGRAPEVAVLASVLGTSELDVAGALARLAAKRHLVLDAAGAIVMAHPFSALPVGFAVMGRATLWWGGCAWDAFALPHVLKDEPPMLVATRCPGCGRALAWNVGRSAPPNGAEVAHFLVPVAEMWHDVVHTCSHQRLFCGNDCVSDWLARTGNRLGSVLDLETLWRLSSHWYDGRLSPGYVRREPAEAQTYFESVGLRGTFWGVE